MSLELQGNSHAELLKCVLCRNAPLKPLLLTCLHYVCKSCADNAKGSVLCGDCQVMTDCSTVPVDHLCSSLVQRSLTLQNLHCCGPCSDDEKSEVPAFSWCYDCQRSLCSDCDSEHQRQNRSHTRHAVDKLTVSPELYRLPSRTCVEDDKELSLACFTCYKAKCPICAHSCYKSFHDVLPLGHRSFAERLAECKSEISALLSSLNSSAVRLDSHVVLSQSIAEAQERDITTLENAKKIAIGSLSRAFEKSRQSLIDCYESVKTKAQTLCQGAQEIKATVYRANEHCEIALHSDDVLGLFTQLNVLKSSVHELQNKVASAAGPIDVTKLVHSGVCLPDNLDRITSQWLGQAKLLKDDMGCMESQTPSHADSASTRKEAVQELLIFGAASATVKLLFPCCDVSVTDDGRLLLAEFKGHLLECATSGQELSRWRPPKRKDGEDDRVVAVETLSDGRAAVGVSYVNVVVLLKRVSGATGDEAWIENQRLDQLQVTPLSLSACGEMLAVAYIYSIHAEVIRLSHRQQHSKIERKYYIQSVAITDKLIITVSFSYIEPSSNKRPHVVDAHARGGDRDQLLWRYELPEGEQARDVCVDNTGQVVYFTVARTYSNSGRVTAVNALDGKVLRKDVISFDRPLLPYKLSLSKVAKETLLVVLAYDSSTAEWGKTVMVYRSAVADTDVSSAQTTITTL